MSTPAVRNPNVIAMGLVANPSNDERQPWECPLTLERYVDPVTDECGCTFERVAIINMVFKDKVEARCPATRNVIHKDKLVPNRPMRDLCEARAKQEALAGQLALSIPMHPNGGSGPAAGTASSSDPRIEEILDMMKMQHSMMKMQHIRSVESEARLNAKIDCLQRKLDYAVEKLDVQALRMNNMLAMTICDMAFTFLPQMLGGADLMTIANRRLTEKQIALVTQPEPEFTLQLPPKELSPKGSSMSQQFNDYKGAL